MEHLWYEKQKIRRIFIDYSMCFLLFCYFKGVLWPCIATVWAHWAPPFERSRLVGIGNSGSQIGNAIALPIAGYLCSNG